MCIHADITQNIICVQHKQLRRILEVSRLPIEKGIIGKKVGMTQIFTENGEVIPVTVIEAGPCVVVQKKTMEKRRL